MARKKPASLGAMLRDLGEIMDQYGQAFTAMHAKVREAIRENKRFQMRHIKMAQQVAQLSMTGDVEVNPDLDGSRPRNYRMGPRCTCRRHGHHPDENPWPECRKHGGSERLAEGA